MNTTPNFVSANNADELARQLAVKVAQLLQTAVTDNGKASLVVSGGSTPKPFFEILSTLEIDWQHVVVTLADERWVPPTHEDSNEQLVKQHLLQNQAAVAQFCSLYDEHAATAEAGVPTVADRLAKELPQPITVLILGMGGDGHTASLFPDTDGLESAMSLDNAATVQIMRPAVSPHARITLTRSALLRSSHRFLHVTGDAKKAMIDAIATPEGDSLPIARFLDQSPITVYWAP